MNKLKFLALSIGILLLSGKVAFAYDSPTFNSYNEKRNVAGRQSDPVRILKLVRNPSRDSGATLFVPVGIVSGDAVSYSLISDDGVTVNTVDVSTDGAFAGIAVTAIPSADAASTSASDDIGKRNWGWIAVHGPVLAKVTAGGTNAHVAGDAFLLSRDFGAVTSIEIPRGVGSNSPSFDTVKAIGRKGGFFMDNASSTLTQEEVFVQAE